MTNMLRKYLPILSWLPNYTKDQLGGDMSAGLTVGIMLVPQGMAYAMLAGLPPIYGLYAATIPLLAYALFGTSRQLAVGPVAMDSLLVAIGVSKLAEYGTDQFISLAILLALMVGTFQLLLGVFRLGFLVNFLSRPVISGFTSAAALIIALNQFPHLMGVTMGGSNQVHLLVIETISNIPNIHLATLLIGVSGIVAIVLFKRFNKAIPGGLLAVIGGIIVVSTVELSGVKIVGNVPAGFPSFQLPTFTMDQVMALLPTALTIALVGFMEAFAVAKATQAKHKNYKLDANQELIGIGMANLTGSFFQSFPVTGGFSRTAVNDQSGAKTQLAAIISAALIVLTLLFLTPLFYHLPKAILASIILVAIVGLIDLKEIVHLWKTNRRDLVMLLITFFMTMMWGIQQGIAIGVGISLFMVLYETSYPHYAVLGRLPSGDTFRNIKRYAEAKEIDKVLIIRFDAKLFFGNTTIFQGILEEEIGKRPGLRLVILSAEAINTLDSSAAHVLGEIVDDLKAQHIDLVFATVKGPVRDVMMRAKIVDKLGKKHFFNSIQDAIANFDGEALNENRDADFQTNLVES
jgi:SulP family sulfate permease